MAEFRLVGALSSATPPLLARSSVGKKAAIVWLRNEDLTWKAVASKQVVPPVPPTVLRLGGLAPGRWRVERWDTWAGRVTDTSEIIVGSSGQVRIPMPKIVGDLALKLVKTG